MSTPDSWIRSQVTTNNSVNLDTNNPDDELRRAAGGPTPPPSPAPEDHQRPPGRPREQLDGNTATKPPVNTLVSGAATRARAESIDDAIRRQLGYPQ